MANQNLIKSQIDLNLCNWRSVQDEIEQSVIIEMFRMEQLGCTTTTIYREFHKNAMNNFLAIHKHWKLPKVDRDNEIQLTSAQENMLPMYYIYRDLFWKHEHEQPVKKEENGKKEAEDSSDQSAGGPSEQDDFAKIHEKDHAKINTKKRKQASKKARITKLT